MPHRDAHIRLVEVRSLKNGKGLDDSGLQVKPSKYEYIPVKLLAPAFHPPEAPTGWKVRHDE